MLNLLLHIFNALKCMELIHDAFSEFVERQYCQYFIGATISNQRQYFRRFSYFRSKKLRYVKFLFSIWTVLSDVSYRMSLSEKVLVPRLGGFYYTNFCLVRLKSNVYICFY